MRMDAIYLLIVFSGYLLALALLPARAKRAGVPVRTALLFGAAALPLGVIFARGCYWLCSLDLLKQSDRSFWDFLDGGYMLYGAALGGIAAGLLVCCGTGTSLARLADAAAVSAALMIAVCRFAEYRTGMGFGVGVYEWFDPEAEWSMIAWEEPELLCRFPFAVQNYYGSWRFAINLWEGLAAGILLIVLLRMKKRQAGGEATLLLFLYAVCQIVLESMRRDEVVRWSFVRVSQLLSALIVLGVLIFCWSRQPAELRKGKELAGRTAGLILLAGIMMLMEFVLDQKIGFLLWIRADLSYLIDAACCAGMIALVIPLWRKAFPEEAGEKGRCGDAGQRADKGRG